MRPMRRLEVGELFGLKRKGPGEYQKGSLVNYGDFQGS